MTSLCWSSAHRRRRILRPRASSEHVSAHAVLDEKLVGEIRLQAAKNSVAQARRFATELAADLEPAVRGVLVLLVSEVATNCVTHAATDFTVKIFRSARRLRVECTDYAEGAVTVERVEPTDTPRPRRVLRPSTRRRLGRAPWRARHRQDRMVLALTRRRPGRGARALSRLKEVMVLSESADPERPSRPDVAR